MATRDFKRMHISFNNPEDALNNLLKYNTHKLKQGVLGVISGSQRAKTGTGKSWTCCKIGYGYDPEFDVKKDVVYTPLQFLKVMDSWENEGRKHRCMVVDEGEIMVNNQLFMSNQNRQISYALSTCRYLESVSLFATPSFSWLDRKVRYLTNYYGYTEKYETEINPNTNIQNWNLAVKLRLYQITTDLFGDYVFLNKIKMYDKPNRRIVTVKEFTVRPLPEDVALEYEKASKENKKRYRTGLIRDAEKLEANILNEEINNPRAIYEKMKEFINKIYNDEEIVSILKNEGKISASDLNPVVFRLTDGTEYSELTTQKVNVIKDIINGLWRGKK